MAHDKDTEHDFNHKISNGPNARPLDATIDQAAPGLPDDSSKPVDITPEEEKAIAEKLIGKK